MGEGIAPSSINTEEVTFTVLGGRHSNASHKQTTMCAKTWRTDWPKKTPMILLYICPLSKTVVLFKILNRKSHLSFKSTPRKWRLVTFLACVLMAHRTVHMTHSTYTRGLHRVCAHSPLHQSRLVVSRPRSWIYHDCHPPKWRALLRQCHSNQSTPCPHDVCAECTRSPPDFQLRVGLLPCFCRCYLRWTMSRMFHCCSSRSHCRKSSPVHTHLLYQDKIDK